jgi:hypothetical protein
MLVSEVLNSAARKLGLIASNEALTTFEMSNSLIILQTMLRSWSSELINVNSSVNETKALVASTANYTWGTGGDIDTLRPNKLLRASILSSTVTSSVDIISEGEYNRIPAKATEGTPSTIFVQYTYPLVNIYLYPTPNAIVTLNLYSVKPFVETSSFALSTDTLALPVVYEEPIIYNVALRMATEFGITVPAAIVAVADRSYRSLVSLNAANYIEPIKMTFPVNPEGERT